MKKPNISLQWDAPPASRLRAPELGRWAQKKATSRLLFSFITLRRV